MLPFGKHRESPQRGWLSSKPLQRLCILVICAVFAFLFFQPFRKAQHALDSALTPLSSQGWENYMSWAGSSVSSPSSASRNPNRREKPKAAFVAMVRERQLGELLPTLRDIQWAFNDDPEHGYDFIFLSEVPFSDWFQKLIQDFLSKRPSKPNVSFGVIPKEHWDVPPQINLEKARKGWEYRLSKSIPYAHSQTYRQMCRYMSAPIYQHSLLKDLDYIWRLEPQTQHLCTLQSHWKEVNGKREWIERDPFRYMRDNHKKYAWANIMTEYKATVMSLMAKAHWWRRDYPQYIAANNSWSFVTDDGKGYNLCHYWTNFEIVDLSFVRSPAYTTFFEVLDKSGGFFLERWGDAPVRTLAASMMLDRSEVWHMDYIGYFHPPVTICPLQKDPGQSCVCDPHLNLDYSPGLAKCQARSDELYGIDSIAVIQSINKDRGVIENFKEGEMAYAIPPPRLATQPII